MKRKRASYIFDELKVEFVKTIQFKEEKYYNIKFKYLKNKIWNNERAIVQLEISNKNKIYRLNETAESDLPEKTKWREAKRCLQISEGEYKV